MNPPADIRQQDPQVSGGVARLDHAREEPQAQGGDEEGYREAVEDVLATVV